ncbi:hypothetical protein PSCICL_45590 [Pseudomonas cichorii]|nr:hypothetical protein PSCICL_45590 [Pseudomonas cichorii]
MKVFLSHSSKDKDSYVKIVAEKVGPGNYVYDAWTFEEGERTSDEIIKGIDESSVFAFFISNFSLESKWVKDEVARAEIRLSESQLKKIYPIIIDSSITYDDARIPQFLKDHYNLKLVTRPTVAARRIQAKLRELHWQNSPYSQKREQIFVGRNEILSEFEARVDNIDLPKPSCIVASGISKIGRSKLVGHALIKSNLVKPTFVPIKITLERVDSIEDLIIKIFDTGLSSLGSDSVLGLLEKSMVEKEDVLSSMLRDIHKAKEVIFVEDNGCLIDYSRELAGWLKNALGKVGRLSRPVLCISARYRLNRQSLRGFPFFYAIEVPELNPRERSGLMSRLLELYELQLRSDDFRFFADQLKGYPEEVYYCVDLISDLGVAGAKRESHQITEFNEERASLLLRKYESNSGVLDFIYLLSEFEFVGVAFIYEIVDEAQFSPVLDELITNLICDYVGAEKEYVRLNDTIRDLVKRNRLSLREDLKEKLRHHVQEFLKDKDKFDRDSADFFYSVKESLASGRHIDDKFLAPSHILRTIKELYQKRENLKRVVHLADTLLAKEASLDPKVSQDARYYLCLSLARQKDKRVLSEAQHVKGAEHDFVLGYYYRLCGRHTDAIERLTKLVDTPYISSRAKRELVQVYLYIEEFEKALNMARENYEQNRGNQFPIQAYLQCLLNSDECIKYRETVVRLIEELDKIGSQQSKEMTLIARALFEYRIEHKKTSAYNYVDDAIALDAKSPYPYLTKFDIALRDADSSVMLEVLEILESISQTREFSRNTISKNRAYYLASTGKLSEAFSCLETSLSNFPAETIGNLKVKVRKIYERRLGAQ